MHSMKTEFTHIGWVVVAMNGDQMFWGLDGEAEALTYCADGAKPAKVYVDAAEFKAHEDAQIGD